MSHVTAVALPHKQRTRRLVIVDIENIANGPLRTWQQGAAARAAILMSVGAADGDHVVIGSDITGLLYAGLAWKGARRVVGHGENGADLALLEVLTSENVETRFTEIVIASGDGIFADVAADLGRAGIRVTVVGHRGHVARRLCLAAGRVVYVPRNDSTHIASDHGSVA